MNISPIFCFDLDGTLADFYGVPNWLDMLKIENPYPYKFAKPLLHFSSLARQLNEAQRKGAKLVIISWSSKTGSPSFHANIAIEKRNWLAKHLPSVHWDEIYITSYGKNKAKTCGVNGDNFYLFDDELPNRFNWENCGGIAHHPIEILEVLRKFNSGKL